MLFDTHAHLDDEKFDDDREEVIKKCIDSGIGNILNASADPKDIERIIELTKKYDFIYASVGVHPHHAEEIDEKLIEKLYDFCKVEKVVAVGEIGLDYYYDYSPKDIQRKWFARQISMAKDAGLPIIVHNRDAHEDTLKILRSEKAQSCGGVLHCFTGSVEMAEQLIKMGFYISIAGPVTFKNAKKLIDVVKMLPEDRILIETDCPYLTPEPNRGKRNDSSNVRYTAEKIAQIRGIDYEHIEKITTANAKRLFKI